MPLESNAIGLHLSLKLFFKLNAQIYARQLFLLRYLESTVKMLSAVNEMMQNKKISVRGRRRKFELCEHDLKVNTLQVHHWLVYQFNESMISHVTEVCLPKRHGCTLDKYLFL